MSYTIQDRYYYDRTDVYFLLLRGYAQDCRDFEDKILDRVGILETCKKLHVQPFARYLGPGGENIITKVQNCLNDWGKC